MGAVFYPYFVRDNRKLSEYLKISEDVHVVKNAEELRALLKAYQVRFRIANTTALCVGEVMYEPYHSWNWGYAMIKAIQQKFGVTWKHISSEKFMQLFENWNGAYEKGSMQRDAAADRSHPERNPKNAEKLYYVLKELIEETGADAMTINCLYSMIHTGIGGNRMLCAFQAERCGNRCDLRGRCNNDGRYDDHKLRLGMSVLYAESVLIP